MTKRNNRRSRRNNNGGFTSVLKEVSKFFVIPENSTSGASVELLTVPTDAQSCMTVRSFTTDLVVEIENANLLSGIEKMQYYVMFLPEGHVVTPNLPFQHPEWIISYAYQGTPKTDDEQIAYNIRKRSRKSRKLRSGDSLILFTLGENNNAADVPMYVSGLIKYFSKMN